MRAKGRPEREQAPERASAEGGPMRAKGRPERERAPERASAEGGPTRAKGPSKDAPPDPWLLTLRLAMRRFVREDYDDVWRLDSDLRVMKYITGKPATRDETHATIERVTRYYDRYPDLGAWYTVRRDSGKFIGWFSLKYAGRSPDVEIGYRLRPEAWGQGFATEGAKAMHDYGFDDLGLYRIIGVTHPGNRASQRVLLKTGLSDRGWGNYYDQRLRLFVADSPHVAT